jgi:hypothetical protein
MNRLSSTVVAIASLATLVANLACAQFGEQFFKLTADDGAQFDDFGVSVAISGNTAIVGARGVDGANPPGSVGAAYLFDVSTGQQLARLNPDNDVEDDWFGWSVGISGSKAIVGALQDHADVGISAGSAYLFDVSTGGQIAKLIPSDSSAGAQFGCAVAISGNTALVGAHLDDAGGNASGAAYLFDATTGAQLAKLTAGDAAEFERFGEAVAIDGTTAIVGAWRDSDLTGAAYVFDVTTGAQLHKLTPADPATGEFFGQSVAISGNLAVIGRGDAIDYSGSAYVFDTTTGQQLAKLTPSDAMSYDGFGIGVSISGNTVIVGAGSLTTDNGAAYLFDATTGEQLAKLTSSDAENPTFGIDVAIDGNAAIAGGEQSKNAADIRTGAAYLFLTDRDEAAQTGDFDANTIVNSADYVAWRNGLGTSYNLGHYNVWRANFGAVAAGGTHEVLATIPEPSAVTLFILAAAFTLRPARRSL